MICLEHPELTLTLNSFQGGGWIGLLEAEELFGRGIGGKEFESRAIKGSPLSLTPVLLHPFKRIVQRLRVLLHFYHGTCHSSTTQTEL